MLRTDLRERVGDAVALDVGVGGDLGEGRLRAAEREERRGRARLATAALQLRYLLRHA